MIVGVFLKGYKTYKRTHFVPVSMGHRFTAFVGPNGAGKSSVLEALGTYFNQSEWIVNKSAKQDGHLTNYINLPYVCPVFAVKKADFETARSEIAPDFPAALIEKISNYLWSVEAKDVPNASGFDRFAELRTRLSETLQSADHFLLVSGIRDTQDKDVSPTYFGPFHAQPSFIAALGLVPSSQAVQLDRAKENDASIRQTTHGDLNPVFRGLYDYIHIPSDVIIADFTKLETGTMQLLMGRSIDAEIKTAIPSKVLNDINRSLEETVQSAVKGLPNYSYDKPKGGKKNITLPALSKLITKEFFSIRELSVDTGDGIPTPVSNLSSGEQRRALVDVAANYLRSGAADHQQTILAIDEPEISLHTSRCFDQFEELFNVARGGTQTLVTTHWYGFLPIAQEGAAHFLERNAAEINCDSYDLADYKEKATKALQTSKGQMPFDVSLKSVNDLVQSIASSLRVPDPYAWILCEGSSERIYLNHMLAVAMKQRRVRVLPLGGAGAVVNVLRYLEVALEDKTFKSNGRVIALIDTDEQAVNYTRVGSGQLVKFKRLMISKDTGVTLLEGESTTVSPATAIEDVLDPETFITALKSYQHLLTFEIEASRRAGALASGSALDLKQSETEELRAFFAEPGRKTDFARRYVEVAAEVGGPEPLAALLEKELK